MAKIKNYFRFAQSVFFVPDSEIQNPVNVLLFLLKVRVLFFALLSFLSYSLKEKVLFDCSIGKKMNAFSVFFVSINSSV
ncbi:hypothetical protein CCAN12_610045 [Capnocytophaga canimorsus]|uniref:Uncharacterized protein n=1 Tax=Capnocytophaga canimorsus TaxID=28188 RepID=A0A0B7HAF0_9FLAO|nr:hypothetical protein CCAN12_610045 [Capnocytophaga canimorsus]